MIKKIFPFILGFVIIFSIPLVSSAAGLVPDCNKGAIDNVKGQYTVSCGFDQLILMINNIITYVLTFIITPIFALILVYVGFLYIGDMGSSENKNKAKKILKNAVIGFVIALAAWLIVKTILTSLGFTGTTFLA